MGNKAIIITLELCNNHSECPANIPYCCGSILGHCKENCNWIPCKLDNNCGFGECCIACLYMYYASCIGTNVRLIKIVLRSNSIALIPGFNMHNSCNDKHCMVDVQDCAAKPTECCKDGWFFYQYFLDSSTSYPGYFLSCSRVTAKKTLGTKMRIH